MNIKMLNAVKDQLITFANDKGIILANEFKSVDDFRNFVIMFTINAIVEHTNMPVEKAYEVVMGDGAWTMLADSVWESINATA